LFEISTTRYNLTILQPPEKMPRFLTPEDSGSFLILQNSEPLARSLLMQVYDLRKGEGE